MTCPDFPCPQGCQCEDLVANCDSGDFEAIPEVPINIKALTIVSNQINSLTFSIAQYDIFILDLTSNNLTILQPEQFGHCRYLWELKMSKNFISYIESNTFGQCKNLKDLDLSYNPLTHISLETLAGLRHLKTFTGNNMNLTSMEPGLLRPMVGLRVINLSYN
ncbi:hypothetical protein CAPTEDRAFT_93705, partial [Capitella teleta]